MIKKLTALVLSALMLFSLAACGDNNTADGNTEKGFLFKNKDSVELGNPTSTLDPKTVYSSLTYTPEMFYGDYRIIGGDGAEKKFGAESEYFTWTKDNEEIEYTILPFRIKAGKDTMSHSINYIEDHNWMELYYMRRNKDQNNESYLDFLTCAYTIEENRLILKPLDDFAVDKENNKITYSFTDQTWEYTFAFDGRHLTLSSDDSSVTLTTGLDAYGEHDYFYADNYLSPDSKGIDDIDQLEFRYDSQNGDSRIYFETVNGETSYDSIGRLQENGLFTFTVALEDSVKTYQYVYFYCGNDGIILTDGKGVYYYNDTYSDRNKYVLNEYLTEDQTGRLDELSETQLEALVEKKENLMDDLAKAFNDAGIKVTVDEKSGELIMDSSILFGGDSAVLTDDGKAFLNKFVSVYTSIVFSEKYDGFVSKTVVEGHTAPLASSTYESGLPLSEERANNVKNYCISSETGVDTSMLADTLEAIGYSNSKPIKDSDGNVDMSASRRVSFRFIINLEQQ